MISIELSKTNMKWLRTSKEKKDEQCKAAPESCTEKSK